MTGTKARRVSWMSEYKSSFPIGTFYRLCTFPGIPPRLCCEAVWVPARWLTGTIFIGRMSLPMIQNLARPEGVPGRLGCGTFAMERKAGTQVRNV